LSVKHIGMIAEAVTTRWSRELL